MTKKLIYKIMLPMLFLGAIFAGCASSDKPEQRSGQKNTVAVSIIPQQAFVQAVCGDMVDTIVMVPPGSSPETYEPTPVEIQKLNEAALYFTIGISGEDSNILSKISDNKDLKVVRLGTEVSKIYPDIKFDGGERDPHIWLSPKRAEVMVGAVLKEMVILDPDNKDIYEKNANKYIKELSALDDEIKALLEPVKNKKFIVFHPAFGYFADDYDLEMYSLEQDGKESTPAHLRQMIDLAKRENIKAIFYQAEIDSKQSQAFAQELGGKTIQLSPLSPDYIENLKKMAQTIKEVVN